MRNLIFILLMLSTWSVHATNSVVLYDGTNIHSKGYYFSTPGTNGTGESLATVTARGSNAPTAKISVHSVSATNTITTGTEPGFSGTALDVQNGSVWLRTGVNLLVDTIGGYSGNPIILDGTPNCSGYNVTNVGTLFATTVREGGISLASKYASKTLFAGSGTTGTVTSAGGDAGKFLKADATWATPAAGSGGDVYAASNNVFAGGTTQAFDQATVTNMAIGDALVWSNKTVVPPTPAGATMWVSNGILYSMEADGVAAPNNDKFVSGFYLSAGNGPTKEAIGWSVLMSDTDAQLWGSVITPRAGSYKLMWYWRDNGAGDSGKTMGGNLTVTLRQPGVNTVLVNAAWNQALPATASWMVSTYGTSFYVPATSALDVVFAKTDNAGGSANWLYSVNWLLIRQ